jgi:hypothetical protein
LKQHDEHNHMDQPQKTRTKKTLSVSSEEELKHVKK